MTLIDFASKLLHSDPEVEPIIRSINERTEEDLLLEERRQEEEKVNSSALLQLTDMGFSEDRAKRALRLNNMSPLEAMDWLLAYDSSTQSVSSIMSAVQQKQRLSEKERQQWDQNAVELPDVEPLIRAYATHKRRTFRVNKKAVTNLKQMGFEEEEVLDALWLHTNNEVAACEWLLSERRPTSLDLRLGLKSTSPVHQAILSDATVSLGLMKARILFSLMQLLLEPNCMGRWLNDPLTAPVLSQVFRIYHSEKHASANFAPTDRLPQPVIDPQSLVHNLPSAGTDV